MEIIGNHEPFEMVRGEGCDNCNFIGYRGQLGLFEMLVADESIERLIMERSILVA